MPTLFWLQAGACSGDSMSFLCAEEPDLTELLQNYNVDLLFHPSLSAMRAGELQRTIQEIEKGDRELTVFCLEGSVITGPNGSGKFDTLHGRPKMEIIHSLASRAHYVLAMGSCASFGGVPAAPPNLSESKGLQFTKEKPGGLLPPDWKSKSGLPVINLSGCPVHPSTQTQLLISLLLGIEPELDSFHRPLEYYQSVVHQGCTRNEYHEFDVEERQFGEKGCLFFNLGCQGPYTAGTCNQILWNKRNSKTRAGVPCFGCTMPDFPKSKDLFATDKIGSIPRDLPPGVKRPNYMAYKGLARAATPQRLLDRWNRIS